jgi:hypothetical protein
MEFGNMSLSESINMLEQYVANPTSNFTKAEEPKEEKQVKQENNFVLPPKYDGKYSRAFAYLTKTRCISPEVVKEFMQNDKNNKSYVYEDERHNVVFVGKDENGKDVFATKRSTFLNSYFKGDVAHSDQSIGFSVNNNSNELCVCESAIDLMSLMTIHGSEEPKVNYLATCGVAKDQSIYKFLKVNPQIKNITLCNDNDTAGREADERITKHLEQNFPDINVKIFKPSNGKDLNEALQIQSQVKQSVQSQTKALSRE